VRVEESYPHWREFNLPLRTRMKELREKYRITQEQLADMVGVRRETILFLEKGKYNPSLRLAYSIAKVLKSKIEDVFFYE
jgi:putative transcriptional regulator